MRRGGYGIEVGHRDASLVVFPLVFLCCPSVNVISVLMASPDVVLRDEKLIVRGCHAGDEKSWRAVGQGGRARL